jgi:hypothetical protein
VLLVGGSGEDRATLLQLLRFFDLRAIDGSQALGDDRSDRLSGWADVVILWNEREFHHTVTEQFEPRGRQGAMIIASDELTVAALLDRVAAQLPADP